MPVLDKDANGDYYVLFTPGKILTHEKMVRVSDGKELRGFIDIGRVTTPPELIGKPVMVRLVPQKVVVGKKYV